MKTAAIVGRLAGVVVASMITGAGGLARAHGDVDVDRDSSDRSQEARGGTSPQVPHEGYPRESRAEDRFLMGLDLVLGWGRVPFAAQNLPTTGTQAITYTYSGATPSNVQSFIVAGSLEATKHLAVGARLPFAFASFSPSASVSRSATSFGNIELEMEYATRVAIAGASELSLVGGFGVALPTAQGDEIPPELLAQEASSVDQTAYDRFSLNRAAAMARGNEDDALFEPRRLGLVPEITLVYRKAALRIEPSLKVENLIGISTSLGAPYLGELVPALRIGYGVSSVVDLVLRGWATVRFAAKSADRQTTVAVEPGLMFRLGSAMPYAGVVIPLTGLPFDDSFFAIRLGVVAGF